MGLKPLSCFKFNWVFHWYKGDEINSTYFMRLKAKSQLSPFCGSAALMQIDPIYEKVGFFKVFFRKEFFKQGFRL